MAIKSLKNKRILITSGPTWVPIDSVRVISNIATGQTGILLAKEAKNQGAKVTLLLGPVESCCLDKSIKLIRFNFFNELRDRLIKELRSKKYNVVIHSAAVSDYQPVIRYARKVKSGIKKWSIDLTPTPKIIDLIRKIDRSLFLVGFKFEPQAIKSTLIEKTKNLISRSDLDLAVANTIYKKQYQAYIVNENKIYGPLGNKRDLAKKLIRIIGENLWNS